MLLLDLFCCAGGAARGYADAGFDVIGVDIEDQKHYPYSFIMADAMDLLESWVRGENNYGLELSDFDAIHASPPCQGYSTMSHCRPGLADEYPKLIEPVRELLVESGLPYVIENVIGSPLKDPATLCGTMFGRELYRHRLFEANFPLPSPVPQGDLMAFLDKNHECGWPHDMTASKAGHWRPGTVMSVAGHFSPVWKGYEIMGIDWMNRDEVAEAIPPCYTEYVGQWLTRHLESAELMDAR